MKIDKKLSEVFDVEVIKEHDVITPSGEVIPPDNNDEEYDYEKTRRNIHTIIEYGMKGIDFAFNVARSDESARSIEAFTALMKNVQEINSSLMELHEKRNRIKPEKEKGQIVQNQQNNVFVGTTKDLSNFIKGLGDNINSNDNS
jgi:hypothetical protein